MHVLFSALAAHGHVFPLLPLARAAAARGHRVTFATGADFAPLLARLGFTAAAVGIGMSEAFRRSTAHLGEPVDHTNPDDPALRRASARSFGYTLPTAFGADIGELIDRDRPDLVVHEVANPGAAIAAAARGVPTLAHGIGRGRILEIFPDYDAELAAAHQTLGADTSADPMRLADPYLDIYPLSLQERPLPTRMPLRPTPFAEPGELPAWVAEHREPLVYLTLGTAFSSADALTTAVHGLAELPARLLVAAGPMVDTADLRDVPPSVTVLPWVPQADLLPHTDLVVHHGGAGTSLASLSAGLPQLFLPQGADQFINADAITAAGIGHTLRAPTAESITEAATALLSDGTARAKARSVAAEIAAMPGPADVADRLPELAQG
ncbi:glycosyltransferase [Actinokineospora guangxiensis]|uniref:Glycosyltransferase n=1 Tax=Actinokineospora guangxiensis TaxID=1490288 RepID=A0ABW0ERR4_9PSEU